MVTQAMAPMASAPLRAPIRHAVVADVRVANHRENIERCRGKGDHHGHGYATIPHDMESSQGDSATLWPTLERVHTRIEAMAPIG